MKKFLNTKNILIAVAFLAIVYFLFFYGKDASKNTGVIEEDEEQSGVSSSYSYSPSTESSSDVLIDESSEESSSGLYQADTGVSATGRSVGRSFSSRRLRKVY